MLWISGALGHLTMPVLTCSVQHGLVSSLQSRRRLLVRTVIFSVRVRLSCRDTHSDRSGTSDLTPPPATRAGTGCRSRAAACTARARATTLTCPCVDPSHTHMQQREKMFPSLTPAAGSRGAQALAHTMLDLVDPTRVVAEVVFDEVSVEIITE